MEEGLSGVSFPKCEHTVCVGCFKRCFYGEQPVLPDFPFQGNGREEEYWDYREGEADRPEWLDDTALEQISLWEQETERIEDEKERAHEAEENLRKCPLCRK